MRKYYIDGRKVSRDEFEAAESTGSVAIEHGDGTWSYFVDGYPATKRAYLQSIANMKGGMIEALESKSKEAVNHPEHYGGDDNPYEAIKVIEAWELGFNLGNTVKYISRAGKKGDRLEDLKKAKWYLDREIKNAEAEV